MLITASGLVLLRATSPADTLPDHHDPVGDLKACCMIWVMMTTPMPWLATWRIMSRPRRV
jgi:hypothetical protein